jgi:DNA-binding response OmpR family regulator
MPTRAARILVAEDSPTQAEGLRLILESEGFEVVVVVDGHAALATARSEPLDLVLSDVTMPGLDGYALCQALREDSATAELPLVVLTGLDDPSAAARGLEVGIDGWLRKPVDIDALLGAVRGVLARAARRRDHDRELREVADALKALSDPRLEELLARLDRLLGRS